ncbi:MAG TPA: hypothetical protein VME67_09535 [Mycobacterium sp.]|nr:hypothetical protein [Mycobacterium sp.]HTX95062.1 hypothetical protein [Mycobacterium sp.]
MTADLFEGTNHHGLLSSAFVTPFLSMLGLAAERSDKLWRSRPVGLARRLLKIPRVHKRFETANGEAALTMLRQLLRLPHNPHPWDELWLESVVKHPTRDEWWEERNLLPLLKEIDVPVYLGVRLGECAAASPVYLRHLERVVRQRMCAAGHAGEVWADLAVGKHAH